jgi:hypothetical protein
MTNDIIIDGIIKEIAKLPKEKVIEVSDFVKFLNSGKSSHSISEAGFSVKETFDLRNR